MKKIFLSLAMCTLLATGVFAQMTGGLKAGLNLASMGGDTEDPKMKPGLQAGAYLNFALSDQLSLQPELLYYGAGCKFEGGDEKLTYKLNYVSLPVIFMYNVNESFSIQAGPQLGFLASAKLDYEIGGDKVADGVDIKDGFKGIDLGFNIGLGTSFDKFNISARYNFGLSNIIDEDGYGELFDINAEGLSVKNNVIQVSVGYTLFGGE